MELFNVPTKMAFTLEFNKLIVLSGYLENESKRMEKVVSYKYKKEADVF